MVLSKTSFGQAAESINVGGTTGETSRVVQKGKKLYAYHPRSVVARSGVSRGRSMPLAFSCVEKTLPVASNI